MISIWADSDAPWNTRYKPLDRNKVMAWAHKYDVLILDQQDNPERNFIDFKYGSEPNNAVNTILKCYTRDLKFPRPRSFSIAPWNSRRIYVTKIRGIQTFQRIRAMSLLRTRCVFHLWGKEANQLAPAIEPERGHLIVKCDYPFTDNRYTRSFINAKPFSTTSDFLGVSKEIWRL